MGRRILKNRNHINVVHLVQILDLGTCVIPADYKIARLNRRLSKWKKSYLLSLLADVTAV